MAIKITLFRNEIIVEGHANTAEHGKDLVCAAVTAVVFTAAEILSREDMGNDVNIVRGNNRMQLNFLPSKFLYRDYIWEQLLIIKRDHPEAFEHDS